MTVRLGNNRAIVSWPTSAASFTLESKNRLSPAVPTVVIELKFAPADADRAQFVTNALPFRLARCSKYVLGIDQLRRFE